MTAQPRLVLAVQDLDLHRKLSSLLADQGVQVEYRPDLRRKEPADIEADVVVLQAAQLDREDLPEVLLQGGGDDSPGVVVMGEDPGSLEQAELVAAGASAVLDARDTREELAEQLVGLAQAEQDGGLQGPEGGASVAEPRLADFQSRSRAMRDFLDVVRRVASSDSTLLVRGETGVGKERLARAIHAESPRSSGPFVAVNCGALPHTLLESELFGHRKGAFTGAGEDRQGRFEAAAGGTIFLDEIGEMPLDLQVKLLTVLQRHEVQALGDPEPRFVDVRVLAATNRDLEADIEAGRFRADLLYRLNVISLDIPPLRDRREDVPWLTGRFLRHFAELHGRPEVQAIEPAAMERLLAHSWPGNVRELVNAVERAVLLSQGERLQAEDLVPILEAAEPSKQSEPRPAELLELPLAEARRRVLEDFERDYLENLLRKHRGGLGETARDARINPRTLYEKMRRLGLRKEDFR